MNRNCFVEKLKYNVGQLSDKNLETKKEFKLYSEYVEDQKELFMLNLQTIIDDIKKLQNNGEISEYIEVNARIKSFESAYQNVSKKALDDIFGVEILAATEIEIEKIFDSLQEKYIMSKYREHNKKNGYKAKHFTGAINNNTMDSLGIEKSKKENCPVIEIQGKTIGVAIDVLIGKALHSDYKRINRLETQNKYNRDKFTAGDLPEMWSWKSTEKEYRKLKKEEVLHKLYPFLSKVKKEEYKKMQTKLI